MPKEKRKLCNGNPKPLWTTVVNNVLEDGEVVTDLTNLILIKKERNVKDFKITINAVWKKSANPEYRQTSLF